jgi:transcription-repair coupling factor (superfamily II helicase)
VNTIIINNANHFGLSDLHQLRGRVGRSNKKAFAYLFTPPPQHLTDEARKRLRAIEQFSELGSGFNIALRDLDIRGAGDLLGGNQSGFISEIGFETYQKILNEAIKELKENEFKNVFSGSVKDYEFVENCILETDLNLIIPDSYIADISERLNVYRELDNTKTIEELDKIKESLIDRFGEIPVETINLLKTITLRWEAKKLGFTKLVLKNNICIAYFIQDKNSRYYQSESFTRILNYIQSNPTGVDMAEKNNKLRIKFSNIKTIDNLQYELEKIF